MSLEVHPECWAGFGLALRFPHLLFLVNWGGLSRRPTSFVLNSAVDCGRLSSDVPVDAQIVISQVSVVDTQFLKYRVSLWSVRSPGLLG